MEKICTYGMNEFTEEQTKIADFMNINKIPIPPIFEDIDFKEAYTDNPVFSHALEHLSQISCIIVGNKQSEDKALIRKVGGFIANNKISDEIIEDILNFGIPSTLPCLRPMIWKALLNYLPKDTLSKWKEITVKNYQDYHKLLKKYPINIISLTNFSENDINNEILSQIDKDLPRTRTEMKWFAEKDPNAFNGGTRYDTIRRILFTYAKKNSSVGYVQGMNELVAVIYYIFSIDDSEFIGPFVESDTYICFEKLMGDMEQLFKMNDVSYSQLFITLQIKKIKEIMNFCVPQILPHLNDESLNLDVCVTRWIFCLFAQDCGMEMAVNFWDRMFSAKDKMDFLCYIIVAIWKINKDEVCKMEMEEVMRWTQSVGQKLGKTDLNKIVKVAKELQSEYEKHLNKGKDNQKKGLFSMFFN